jgi:uncharacterized membrane protein YhaH (DUF805 family)
MTAVESIRQTFATKYATFSGRADRSEYWFSVLFMVVVLGLSVLGDAAIGAVTDTSIPALTLVSGLAMVLPSLTVTVRRLHDIGRTGWWWFFGFVPFIGWLVLFVYSVLPGASSENRYGPAPSPAMA